MVTSRNRGTLETAPTVSRSVGSARAGRGTAMELLLPEEPTVSRVHAKFIFRDGQWRVTGLGRNGLVVNDMPVRSEQVIRDGDLIRWGSQPGALVSRVQIGRA
jgi:pSer/pThr/pTyr-binding forkhead associated (FHA) protein